jgi:hypothetical protein
MASSLALGQKASFTIPSKILLPQKSTLMTEPKRRTQEVKTKNLPTLVL